MNRLLREGVALAYTEAGEGESAMVLIHGTTSDHTTMAPIAAHFARTHRVVSVDLRGHGASDRAAPYTVMTLTDDVAAVCEALKLARPVIVGHGLGGVVALALAATQPDLPGAIAMLDAPVFLSSAAETAVNQVLEAPDAVAAWTKSFATAFGPHDDPARKASMLEGIARFPADVLRALVPEVFGFDVITAAAACYAPALYIRAVTPADTAHFRRLCPQLLVGETVGAGHFHQLEVPAQVNAMLERFIAIARS